MIGSLPLSVPEPESRIIPTLQIIEDRLMGVTTSTDEIINPPVSHLAEVGGKHLRPVPALLTAQLGDPVLTATGEEIRDAGVAAELIHIVTLYYGDVMDEAPLCRDAPSAQAAWGNFAAILTGDVLVAWTSQLVAALGPEVVMAHAKTFECLYMGQLHETLSRPAGTDPVDHYIQALANKIGSLITAPARYGAMPTGAGTRTEQIVEEFGERISVAPQLVDDVIDLMSDSATTDKTPGADLREGVDTMLVLFLRKALAAGELDAAGQVILSRLSSGDLSDNTLLSDVVVRLREHPILARTREMAMNWVAQAVGDLEGLEEAVFDGARQRLAQAGTEGEAAAAAMTDAGERVRQARAVMEDFARILVDRAA